MLSVISVGIWWGISSQVEIPAVLQNALLVVRENGKATAVWQAARKRVWCCYEGGWIPCWGNEEKVLWSFPLTAWTTGAVQKEDLSGVEEGRCSNLMLLMQGFGARSVVSRCIFPPAGYLKHGVKSLFCPCFDNSVLWSVGWNHRCDSLEVLDVTVRCSACLLHDSVRVSQGEQLRCSKKWLINKR